MLYILFAIGFYESAGNNKILVEKMKKVILELTHTDETIKMNFSENLAKKFHRSYERVKELILYDYLDLSEIAYKLNFSSSAHLCNQFKKATARHYTLSNVISPQHRI